MSGRGRKNRKLSGNLLPIILWRESQFFNFVIFLTNTKNFKNHDWGPLGPFLDFLNNGTRQGIMVSEGFQQKNSSCPDTLLLPPRHGLYVVFDVNLVIALRYLSVIFVPLFSVMSISP